MGGPGVTKYPFYLGVHIEQECYEQGLWFLNKTTRPEHKTSDSFLKKKNSNYQHGNKISTLKCPGSESYHRSNSEIIVSKGTGNMTFISDIIYIFSPLPTAQELCVCVHAHMHTYLVKANEHHSMTNE